ncbi:aldose 1-epimerase [Maribacter sp. MMG018]|uniref:aldose 1-epimerase n=1 Tax=Maribacter sp. MMG018 TaxID=2822688 RepID=UPI001B3961F9|nr:aldose 1-epimerase [Maribacter sp. MMG018]MBQ4914170.1 aldose 1-epimerase [Maribacter sp. MMG018]
MVILSLGNQEVTIDNGELISYKVNGHEYIHQKGSPGWRSSDTEMFPIIGPTNEADFTVETEKGKAVQDQHGLLREMTYEKQEHSKTKVVYKKSYTANDTVKNSKFPEKSTKAALFWPYDFVFEKTFALGEEGLGVTFQISGEKRMPFMLGYHPAFNLTTGDVKIIAGEKDITLPEVLAVGSRAMPVLSTSKISLVDGEHGLTITTQGFPHFMLWTEVSNMVCIEPITFYPYAVDQKDLHWGFDYLSDNNGTFHVFLKPS